MKAEWVKQNEKAIYGIFRSWKKKKTGAASSCSLHPNKCLIWHLCAKLRFFHSFSKKKEGNRDIKQSFHKMKNVQLEYYFVLQINFRKLTCMQTYHCF